MYKGVRIGLVLPLILFFVTPLFAQDSGIKVVPIGESIKPEAQPTKKRRRRRSPYVTTTVKPGQTFLIELNNAISSGISKMGDNVYFSAVENVGPEKRPVIVAGATGEGTILSVDDDKKDGKVTIQLSSIENVKGEDVKVSGLIEIKGKDSQAAAAVGEKYTATLDEKVTVKRKRRPKKSTEEQEPQLMQGFVELSGKKARVDLKKGKAKGKVRIILEGPKGTTADDIDPHSIMLYQVNNFEIPEDIYANEGKMRQGDKNKNGVTDWTLYFDAWEFVRFQPKGKNNIVVRGKLRDGRPFEAITRVQIDY